jgi:hypothetical protein
MPVADSTNLQRSLCSDDLEHLWKRLDASLANSVCGRKLGRTAGRLCELLLGVLVDCSIQRVWGRSRCGGMQLSCRVGTLAVELAIIPYVAAHETVIHEVFGTCMRYSITDTIGLLYSYHLNSPRRNTLDVQLIPRAAFPPHSNTWTSGRQTAHSRPLQVCRSTKTRS